MSTNQQVPIMEPGRALTLLILIAAFGLFWLWLTRHPGWEIAWFGVVVCAALTVGQARTLAQAHRAWRIKRDLEAGTQTPGPRPPTRAPRPPPGRDSW